MSKVNLVGDRFKICERKKKKISVYTRRIEYTELDFIWLFIRPRYTINDFFFFLSLFFTHNSSRETIFNAVNTLDLNSRYENKLPSALYSSFSAFIGPVFTPINCNVNS